MTGPLQAAVAIEDFRQLEGPDVSGDSLVFPGYRERLEQAAAESGTTESVSCGRATIGGHRVVVIVFEFSFMGGSIGEAAGQRLVHAIDTAVKDHVPLVSFVASGGARIQEGMRSLVQMHRVAAALRRLNDSRIPHLSVLRHPTTGGVWVALAAVADVLLAERNATVAFSGPRVRGAELDADAFRAEGKYASGAVDALADGPRLGAAVASYVEVLAAVAQAPPPEPCEPPDALPGALELGEGWEAVQLARAPQRPGADAYLDAYFGARVALSGDRAGGRDPGLLCGVGLASTGPCAYIAQTGTSNTAAGFRTAARVLRLAERWRIPVLTLIDTPGAANDATAEREGIGTAIGEVFSTVAALTTPITSLLLGEGGSGGALALAAPRNLWAVPSSYFSVAAPEAAAAIVYRDAGCAPEVAEKLRLGPRALVDLGIARGLVKAARPARTVPV